MSDNSNIPDQIPDNRRFDRLNTLMERFSLDVRPAPVGKADLLITGGSAPEMLLFGRGIAPGPKDTVFFAARVDWGGAQNPLLAALPERITLPIAQDADLSALVAVMRAEVTAQRCGGGSVLSRLAEVLVVRLLRRQIEEGASSGGVLAGLADPRLSRAIVAMHDDPGHGWTSGSLADVAGLSLSRFSDLFLTCVGETPMSYLRRWRLTLARQDIERGDRIGTVAHRYAYGSAEGFTRAFRKYHGTAPIALRRDRQGAQDVSQVS
ncbi:AraC-like DNA-binding protein [Rubricella aquisinus]|uniref:AraC-like DNA-binding protein n=1 Tax=Rubricella aquisinus TaxID=2028108 RepID=A0A840X457_9RHOB|nr:AraC family transcriptional regulator [Rubricella aquisinus]MBB5515447.1 AraC-like DNA-binding protein [Rubricella aquisinus]